jgi:hypothetical protein
VKKKRDGSYRVWRFDRGEFTTLEARSPGACDTDGRHGTVVHAGARGRMHGYLVGTVPSTFTFNKDAVCPADCGFTDVFLNTHFGPGASDQFSCFTARTAGSRSRTTRSTVRVSSSIAGRTRAMGPPRSCTSASRATSPTRSPLTSGFREGRGEAPLPSSF